MTASSFAIFIVNLLFYWALLPGIPIATMWLFEGATNVGDRIFGAGASKGFIWSNLGYGLIVALMSLASSAGVAVDVPYIINRIWDLIAFVVVLGIFLAARLKFDAPKYRLNEGATADSPSKWTNDILAYIVLPYWLLSASLPNFLFLSWHSSLVNTCRVVVVAIIAGIVVVGSTSPSKLDYAKLHPANWQERNRQAQAAHPNPLRKWAISLTSHAIYL